MPTVFQTLCPVPAGMAVSLEESAPHLGSPGGASNKSHRGCRREFSVYRAFKSSQDDGGEGSRKEVVLQRQDLREECLR